MKVVFFSNYFNHHQKPFSDAMNSLTDVDYNFVQTIPMEDERQKLGWGLELPSYVKQSYLSEEAKQECLQLAMNADVVIIGSAPNYFIKERLKQGKLTFRYSERFYKKGLNFKTFLRALIGSWLHHGRFQCDSLYMLCASAYTAYDCSIFGNYKNKCYKWGYFPQVNHYEIEDLMAKKNQGKIKILWVARFMKLKHPESCLFLAEELKKRQIDFSLTMIGIGEYFEYYQEEIKKRGLEKVITMTGAMSPEAVRNNMEEADIFLFTSDFNEGWGAVLNESMNSACAVVASHAIGSVPFLLKHGENGLIYHNEDWQDLLKQVLFLIDHPQERLRLGKNAYQTLMQTWNAEGAAKNLLQLIEDIQQQGTSSRFADGPCSKAEIIKNNWWK